jgi:capsular polysaccharide biosynthesis protein
VKDLNLRRRLFLKRKLLQSLGFRPDLVTSITNKERRSEVKSQELLSYSDPIVCELVDPRNGKKRGNYFHKRSIYLVQNVILEPRQGVYYSENGKLISESSKWSDLFQYRSFPWNGAKSTKELPLENVISLSSNSFGHWLAEDLAGVISAHLNFPNSPIVVLKRPPKYVSDFLDCISTDKIFVDGPVKVKSAIFTERGKDSGWVHPVDFQILREFGPFKKARLRKTSARRIYASRMGLKRSPINELLIAEMFESYGFDSVKLHELNLLDEISLLTNLDFFAGVHGSAFCNQIWMKNGAKSLEIVNENYWTEMDTSQFPNFKLDKHYFSYVGTTTAAVPMTDLSKLIKKLI